VFYVAPSQEPAVSESESNVQEDARPPLVVYTVGHSNVPLENFLALLARHQIATLVDVRSAPYSRYVPHFNRNALEPAVERAGIAYRFAGESLGGRPEGDEYYDAEGHVLYARVAQTPSFRRGIARLRELAANGRVAVMCGEEDPAGCHRRLLVGRVLAREGALLRHIRADGHVEEEREVALLRHDRSGRRGEEEREVALGVQQAALFAAPDDAAAREEAQWKSIRPVSRSTAPSNSSRPSGEPASDD
jgi:uncharacterized protein DUF488